MFDKNKILLVPPAVQDRANGALNETNNINVRSNYAAQLEVIRDYCNWVLEQFDRVTRKKK